MGRRHEMLGLMCSCMVLETLQGAHGVVASHPLRMRNALGSNPSGSTALALELIMVLEKGPRATLGRVSPLKVKKERKEIDAEGV